MCELLEVWRNSKMADEEFLRRILVLPLPDAKIFTPLDRAQYAKYWREQFTELDALVKEHGPDLLGDADLERYKLMEDLARQVPDMLALIADTLQPQTFDQLVKYGFGDEIPPSPAK